MREYNHPRPALEFPRSRRLEGRRSSFRERHEFDDGFIETFMSPAIRQNKGETIIKFMPRLPQGRGFRDQMSDVSLRRRGSLSFSQMANVA
jgi:hypothetical protein